MLPLLALGAGLVVVVVGIAWGRVHPFFALMAAAVTVGAVAAIGGGNMASLVGVVERATAALGRSAGSIALVIALAAVIGECLTVSGAADRIVDAALRFFGASRVGLALAACGLLLAIPVFFDTVFLLLLPLARGLARRTGKDYLYYIMALCAGAAAAHGTIPPTPGPLLAAEQLNLNLAVAIAGGFGAALLPVAGALAVGRWVAARNVVPPPAVETTATVGAQPQVGPSPGLLVALLPILLPLGLIGAFAGAQATGGTVPLWLALAGDKHLALAAGALAGVMLAWPRLPSGAERLRGLLGRPLESVGSIILITAAGGAFGGMLREVGIGEALASLAAGREVNFVLLGWGLAAVIRVAQGSSTVAMITTVGVLAPAAAVHGWGTNPLWVFLAIGYGSLVLSWANDSGFWLVTRLGGWSERTTLRTWTVVLTSLSVFGLAEVLVLAAIFP